MKKHGCGDMTRSCPFEAFTARMKPKMQQLLGSKNFADLSLSRLRCCWLIQRNAFPNFDGDMRNPFLDFVAPATDKGNISDSMPGSSQLMQTASSQHQERPTQGCTQHLQRCSSNRWFSATSPQPLADGGKL